MHTIAARFEVIFKDYYYYLHNEREYSNDIPNKAPPA